MNIITSLLPEYCNGGYFELQPVAAVLHCISAIGVAPDDPYNIDNIKDILTARKTGYHIIVSRSGVSYILTPLSHRAHHAGPSRTPDGRGAMNGWSYGIAFMGEGKPGINGTETYTTEQYRTGGFLLRLLGVPFEQVFAFDTVRNAAVDSGWSGDRIDPVNINIDRLLYEAATELND